MAGCARTAAAGAFAIAALWAADASAATIEVTTAVDDFDTAAPCSLREAIVSANDDGGTDRGCTPGSGADTVKLGTGIYRLTQDAPGSENASVEGDLNITDDLTLEGAGRHRTTIDGNGAILAENVLSFTGVEATISGLRVRGGSNGSNGGGITGGSLGSITLRDAAVTGNEAGFDGGGISTNGVLIVENSAVRRNVATSDGGAIDTTNDLTITDSTIADNTADVRGGAIRTIDDATISGSRLERNEVLDGFGGAIHIFGASLEVEDSVLSGNSAAGADGDGGAIYAEGQVFRKSAKRGGDPNPAAVTVTTSELVGNEAAGHGGAILNGDDSTLELTDSAIEANTAEGAGGGIRSIGAGLAIDGSEIVANSAGIGGAGIVSHDPMAEISDSAVVGNVAATGGGGLVGDVLKLTDSSVVANDGSSGGGIRMGAENGSLELIRSDVVGNLARSGEGGGIFLFETSATITDSTIADNHASFAGGGVYFASDLVDISVTISGSTLSGNRAGPIGGGGAIDQNGGGADLELDATNTTFSGNASAGPGAAIRAADSVDLNQVTVTGSASAEALGIDPGASVEILNSVVAGNPGDACDGTIAILNNSLLESPGGSCVVLNSSSSLFNVDPLLRPLADNGGPTETHLVQGASPLKNAGDDATCEADDQRGAPRKNCDIGAYERVKCAGTLVNRVGTDGKDRLTGTNKKDGFLLLKGKDVAKGGDGNDAICGGGGGDKLKGQGGNDTLLGEGGNDLLVGGPGNDTCIGGPGSNTLKSC